MFRPITIYDKNIYSFILMKNRFEELAEIPVGYIDNIQFSMGKFSNEPAQVNLHIPSVLEKDGTTVEQPLFNMVKPKMLIHMKINQKDYMLEIRDVSERETKNYTIKNVVAYERHIRLQDLDCTLAMGKIVTRQLYYDKLDKSPNNVEIADGMLNIFEQQCFGWTVDRREDDGLANITPLAKGEHIMHDVTNILYLDRVDSTISDIIFNQNIPQGSFVYTNDETNVTKEVDPLKMTINMFNKVYDANGGIYIDTKTSFDIDSLSYPISNITARIVSNDKYFYGIEFTITYTEYDMDADGEKHYYTTSHQFDYVNCKGLHLIADVNVVYKTGVYENAYTTKYRTFENGGAKWSTMMDNIAQSFDCIFIFDSYKQTVKACHYSEFQEETGMSLTYDNAINEITRTRKIDDLVTRLWVESDKTTIASINVLGTDYVECYDYFKNEGIMSLELQYALDKYDILLAKKKEEFDTLIVEKYAVDQEITLLSSQVSALEERISGAKALLNGYIKDNANAKKDNIDADVSPFVEKQKAQQAIVSNLESELANTKAQLEIVSARANEYKDRIALIGTQINKQYAVDDNGVLIFSEDLRRELADYLIEKSITDDTHLTAPSLYDYGIEQINKYQKLIIDFTIDTSMEFLKRAGRYITDVLFLGAKMTIEDRANALESKDGEVIIYAFSINPNTDKVSNFKFSNIAEAPETPLKSISRTTQVTKATKSLSDFYKATWLDMKNKTIDIEKVLNEGLDLATQKVRSRTEENLIDISEAGIFLIDGNNNNEQLALMNDLICITKDGWRTSNIAISPEGVMADTIIGRLLVGSELYISNTNDDDRTAFHINEDGFVVKNSLGQQKILIGTKANYPYFLVGEENGYHMKWSNDKLTINASSVKIGSKNIPTEDNIKEIVTGIVSGFELDTNSIKMYVDDSVKSIRSELKLAQNQILATVADTSKDLQSQITVNKNGITSSVKKGNIISTINQSAEKVRISASKIDLNGCVTVTKNNRYVKIDTGNYSVYEDKIRKAYFGFGKYELDEGVYTDYYVPRITMGGDGINKMENEYFTVITYKGNKENPQKMDYAYVDICYHSRKYDRGDGEGDWSNVKMYANGDMRVSPIRKLEITSNFKNGKYPPNNNGHEYLIAEFRSDSHTWYNGNLSVGAVVNRTNGNGLILIDQHDSRKSAGVRVQCNNDLEKSFRPLTNGDCNNGTSNYRWKKVYAVSSTISTSDERHKIIYDNMNNFDCYEMVKSIPLYNYYMLGENKNNLTEEEIEERMIDENKQMGLMAQDLLKYECGEYILDYEDDVYGINDNQLLQATMGALQEEIRLRDEQIEELKQDIEDLKQCVKTLMGGE